jgi:hypothetical protein
VSDALKGPRILTKDVPQYTGGFDNLSGKMETHPGWVGTPLGIYHESYFDLSGYARNDLTLVPTLMDLQDAGIYQTTFFTPGPTGTRDEGLIIGDVMSTERLDANATLAILGTSPPGTGLSTENFEQIPMCNVRLTRIRTTNGSNEIQTTVTAGSYGSGEPTAGHKLWLYRFIFIVPPPGTPLAAPNGLIVNATRFILGANIIEESELSHMMRLKRSYELNNYGN